MQTAALDHKYSEEHWFSGEEHQCLTQAVHLDDLFDSHSGNGITLVNTASKNISQSVIALILPRRIDEHPVRAPPFSPTFN